MLIFLTYFTIYLYSLYSSIYLLETNTNGIFDNNAIVTIYYMNYIYYYRYRVNAILLNLLIFIICKIHNGVTFIRLSQHDYQYQYCCIYWSPIGIQVLVELTWLSRTVDYNDCLQLFVSCEQSLFNHFIQKYRPPCKTFNTNVLFITAMQILYYII